MDCPVCNNVTLVMSERQGIEIDYCPNCRGVWLDRGELDKIIERAAAVAPSAPQAGAAQSRAPDPRHAAPDPGYRTPEPRFPQGGHGQQPYGGSGHYQHGQYPHHKKKREGFLGELFDFD